MIRTRKDRISLIFFIVILFISCFALLFSNTGKANADSNNNEFSIAEGVSFRYDLTKGVPFSVGLNCSGSYYSFLHGSVVENTYRGSDNVELSSLPSLSGLSLSLLALTEVKQWTYPRLLLFATEDLSIYNKSGNLTSDDMKYCVASVDFYMDNGSSALISENKVSISNYGSLDSSKTYNYYFKLVNTTYSEAKLFWTLIGTGEKNEVIYTSSNYMTRCLRDSVRVMLANESTESFTPETLSFYEELAEYNVPDYVDFLVYYKNYNNDYLLEPKCFRVEGVPKVFAYNSELALGYFKGLNRDYSSLGFYNIVYDDGYFGIDGVFCNTGSYAPILARDFSYSFDFVGNIGVITVEYDSFRANNLYIKFLSNEPGVDLRINCYTTHINLEYYEMYFDLDEISSNLANSAGWLFDSSDINIESNAYELKDKGISVSYVGNVVLIDFGEESEAELVNLHLVATANVVEDKPYTSVVHYKSFEEDEDSIKETQSSLSDITLMLSEIRKLTEKDGFSRLENYLGDSYALIENALNKSAFNGLSYGFIKGVSSVVNTDDETAVITILYGYTSLFKVYISNETYYYREVPDSLVTIPAYLLIENDSISDNFYVSLIETSEEFTKYLNINNKDCYDYSKTTLFFKSYPDSEYIIPLYVTLSDSYRVHISYFDRYRNSCFAEKKDTIYELSLSEYPELSILNDNEVFSKETVLNILGKDSDELSLGLNSVRIEECKVNRLFDEFYITCIYSVLSLKVTDSNGSYNYMEYALTPFSFWKTKYAEQGVNSSGWHLNSIAPEVFGYSNIEGYNTVDSEDRIYGFFGIVVFQEQVSDFNDWFSGISSCGCKTIYGTKEVKGSWFYRFFNSDNGKVISGGVGATVGLLFGHPGLGLVVSEGAGFIASLVEEGINSEAGTYYTHFLYLDGTSNLPYYKNNLGDNYYDDDPSIVNKVEDVGEEISELTSGLTDSFNNIFKIIKICLGVIIIALTAFAVIRIVVILKPKRAHANYNEYEKPKRRNKS